MLCECGCGKPTAVAQMTRTKIGHIKGQPLRFINGHNARQPWRDRFWTKVNKDALNKCWLWTAGVSLEGYGRFSVNRQPTYAHRISYAFAKGDIPTGMELDHLCRNRICVNPEHLEVVTHQENVLRGVSPAALHRAQTSCVHCHPFYDSNTITLRNGGSDCRTCARTRERNRTRCWKRSCTHTRGKHGCPN